MSERGDGLNPNSQIEKICDDIVDQNERYPQIDTINTILFRTAAEHGISDEQETSLEDLFKTAREIPYVDIGRRCLDAYHSYMEVAEFRDNAKNVFNKDVELLTEDAKHAIELSPVAKSSIESMLAKKVTELTCGFERMAIDELKKAKEDYESAELEFELYGRAWPIPRAVSSQDVDLLYSYYGLDNDLTDSELVVQEDIIPVTPEERVRQASVAEKAKYTIDEPNASQFIIYYLENYINQIVTVEDLTRFLYSADEGRDDGVDYRSRVTTLLGPKTNGRKMQESLSEHNSDFKLQYGWRILKSFNGERWKEVRRTRIFRVYLNGFELPEESPVILSEDSKVCDQWEDMSVIFGLEEPTVDNNTDYPEEEYETDINEDIKDSIDNLREDDRWIDKFTEDVNSAIDELISKHLFFGDDILSGGYIRMVSASRTLGTRTARERLQSAGLMSSKAAKEDKMSRIQRVESLLLNSHQEIFSHKKGKKREMVIGIIESTVEARLDAGE